MSILENKQFHGLPGLGATGQRGATGAEGSSILFGYIEDFFELEEVHIDEFVRYASRGSGDQTAHCRVERIMTGLLEKNLAPNKSTQ